MIKTWQERLPTNLTESEILRQRLDVQAMLAEIAELRVENERLQDRLGNVGCATNEYGQRYPD